MALFTKTTRGTAKTYIGLFTCATFRAIHLELLPDWVTRLNEQSIDRFQHQWIMDDDLTYSSNTGMNWLIYQEGQGMFCLLCRRHSISDNQNNSKYNLQPAIRFKWKAVEDHANSQQHAAAITAKLLRRVSTFEEEARKIEDAKDEVYYKTLVTMKWIAKEEISNKSR